MSGLKFPALVLRKRLCKPQAVWALGSIFTLKSMVFDEYPSIFPVLQGNQGDGFA